MKKWIMIFLISLTLIQIAEAIPICEDRIEVNTSCYIVTPQVGCKSLNITEVRSGNRVINDTNMTLVNEEVYKYEFNQTAGEYLISLCSGHTAKLRVNETTDEKFKEEKTSRMFIAVGIIIAIIVLVLGILSGISETKEIKILFGFISTLFMILGLRFASIVVSAISPGQTALISNLDTFYGILIRLWSISFTILVLYLVWRVFKIIKNILNKRKTQREEGFLFD